MPPPLISISAGEIRRIGHAALARHTSNPETRTRVLESLLQNQIAGYPSHGLLRLPEYLEELRLGRINPNATPQVTRRSASGFEVDGQRSFGVLAADAVSNTLLQQLADTPLVAVSLINSHHIGRLADIARPVAEAGYLLMGYCNYLGAGQKVIPPGNHSGKLCTNPMLFAAPGDGAPLILDMTTSTVAEGKIRSHWLEGKPVPHGWLVDRDFQPVTDASRLYSEPPSAFMTPLGGHDHAYKGFGLAMFCEIFAGILTGATFCGQASTAAGGNGGMFIGLHPNLFGQSASQFAKNLDIFNQHLLAGGENRLPGQSVAPQVIPDDWQLQLSSTILEYLEHAAH